MSIVKPRRDRRPSVELLEGRDLLSVVALIAVEHLAAARVKASVQGSPLELSSAPTPREAAREAFVAKFAGKYVVGPPRFLNQVSVSYFNGGGTSNQFLHGNAQVGINTYIGQPGLTDGTAALSVKNVANTGNSLSLDLHSAPAGVDTLNSRGRPIHLTWTVNGGSGGTFANATGSGTLDVIYTSTSRHSGRSLESGKFGLIFTGRVVTTGVNNITRN